MNVGLHVGNRAEIVNMNREISVTVTCRTTLDYVYYAVARTVLGQTEIIFEHELYGKRNEDFDIILPYQYEKCFVIVHGYLNGKHLFAWEKEGHKVFSNRTFV